MLTTRSTVVTHRPHVGVSNTMPVKVQHSGRRYRVVSPTGKVHAKGTTKAKAEAQRRLLAGVERGWKPTRRRRS